MAWASYFSYTGTTPPTDLSGWKFEGNISRLRFEMNFNSTLASGTRVWLTAFWFNTRHQSGPLCDPVGTNLQGGAVAVA